jgi:hypothetical protein
MLDRALKAFDNEILKRALESMGRPIDPAHAAFEAGRRQGVHQGLQVGRALIEELIRDDSDEK